MKQRGIVTALEPVQQGHYPDSDDVVIDFEGETIFLSKDSFPALRNVVIGQLVGIHSNAGMSAGSLAPFRVSVEGMRLES